MGVEWAEDLGHSSMFCLAPHWGLVSMKRQYLFILHLLFLQSAVQWHFQLSLRPIGCAKQSSNSKQCVFHVTQQNSRLICFFGTPHNHLPSFSSSSVFYGSRRFVVKSMKKLRFDVNTRFNLVLCRLSEF